MSLPNQGSWDPPHEGYVPPSLGTSETHKHSLRAMRRPPSSRIKIVDRNLVVVLVKTVAPHAAQRGVDSRCCCRRPRGGAHRLHRAEHPQGTYRVFRSRRTHASSRRSSRRRPCRGVCRLGRRHCANNPITPRRSPTARGGCTYGRSGASSLRSTGLIAASSVRARQGTPERDEWRPGERQSSLRNIRPLTFLPPVEVVPT